MDQIELSPLRRNIVLLTICSLLVAAALSPALAQENLSASPAQPQEELTASPAQENTAESPSQENLAAPLASDMAADDLLSAGVDEDQLKAGEFIWLPAAQRDSGSPLMIIVNLRAQRAYVYRDGEPIAISTVSTGRPGRETPTGIFEILEKERMHRSNLYDDAPMPFMQRLTWSGLSMHAGHLPGHPASHGCIRLPAKFAEQLYGLTKRGEIVAISDDGSAGALARAGLDTQLNLLASTASTLHAIVGAVGPSLEAKQPANDGVTRTIAADTDDAFSDSR